MNPVFEDKKNSINKKKEKRDSSVLFAKTNTNPDKINEDVKSNKNTASKDEILDILQADYNPLFNDYDDDSFDKTKKQDKNSKKFVPSKNKTPPYNQKDLYTIMNSLHSNYKSTLETFRFFKTLRWNSMTIKKANSLLNLLSNRVFSNFQEISKLSNLVSSDLDMKEEISQIYKREDVFSECTMFTYNLYSLLRLVQYERNNTKQSNNNKRLRFRLKEFDSTKSIRNSEIKRLDSKSTKVLSTSELLNLSAFKNERQYMEGYKSQIRLDNLIKKFSNDLENALKKSSQNLTGTILGK